MFDDSEQVLENEVDFHFQHQKKMTIPNFMLMRQIYNIFGMLFLCSILLCVHRNIRLYVYFETVIRLTQLIWWNGKQQTNRRTVVLFIPISKHSFIKRRFDTKSNTCALTIFCFFLGAMYGWCECVRYMGIVFYCRALSFWSFILVQVLYYGC